MLRVVGTAIREIAARANIGNVLNTFVPKYSSITSQVQHRCFTAFSTQIQKFSNPTFSKYETLLSNIQHGTIFATNPQPIQIPTRTITKYSLRKGKRKSSGAVTDRFYRLDWGIWIRTKAGSSSKMWTKRAKRKARLRKHVFVNATQTKLLEKMTTAYWRRPHYYVDDPYNPYHKREEFLITRKAPL